MLNPKQYINKKIYCEDKISFEKSKIFHGLYRKNNAKLNKKVLPFGWHWIFFNEVIESFKLAEDGHPIRGNFLPKLNGYKRMYAGSSIIQKSKFYYGMNVRRISNIKSINKKKKKNINFYFLTIEHKYKCNRKLLLEESQKLVFLNKNYVSKKSNIFDYKNLKLIWQSNHKLSNVILFRYSAITFNSHRIHYDQDYAKKKEGYRDLLVHGPLLASIILDEIRLILKKEIIEFHFNILKPIYVDDKFKIKIFKDLQNKKKIKILIVKDNHEKIFFNSTAITN